MSYTAFTTQSVRIMKGEKRVTKNVDGGPKVTQLSPFVISYNSYFLSNKTFCLVFF